MNAKTHATILKAMIVIILIGGFLAFAGFCASVSADALDTIVAAFIAFIVLWPVILLFMPVRCNKLECNGQMRRRWVKEPDYQFRLQFTCDKCSNVYDTNITVGLGEPW